MPAAPKPAAEPEPTLVSWSEPTGPADTFDLMEHVATALVPIRSEGDLRVAWLLLTAPYRGQA